MNQPLPKPPLTPTSSPADWMHDRLAEARGIIADISHHPISLVIVACRTIAAHSTDGVECAEAVALWRMLDPRPLHLLVAAAFETAAHETAAHETARLETGGAG